MIVFGICLLIIAAIVPKLAVLWAVGIIVTRPAGPSRIALRIGGFRALPRGPAMNRSLGTYHELMTREEAIAEVARGRAYDSEATWVSTCRDGEWTVARIGVAPPAKPTGTATQPPPAALRDDPHSAIERAAWFAAGG
jgi:hypothetical protein